MADLGRWLARLVADQQSDLGRPSHPPLVRADADYWVAPGCSGYYPSQNPNRVVHLGTRGQASEADVEAFVAEYHGAGLERFFIYLSPGPQMRPLMRWLRRSGMRKCNESSVLAREASGAPLAAATDLEVRRAERTDSEAVRHVLSQGRHDQEPLWSDTVLDILGEPGVHVFLAWCGDEPVATGTLYVHGGLGYLGNGMTLEAFRSRGGQSGLIAARLAMAAELGCDTVTCETYRFLETSYHNLQRQGFSELYYRRIYRWERRGIRREAED